MPKAITTHTIPEHEIELSAVRSSGPGGQHVNKVSSAIHLKFDIHASSLPEWVKLRMLSMRDHRISADGIVTIKAQRFRVQERNRADAVDRLQALVAQASRVKKRRIATRPGKAAKKRRVEGKRKRSQVKALRKRISVD